MYCIYQITNKLNGHRYIGQHKYTDESSPMGKYKGSGKLLHYAYDKYGEESFEIEILYKRIRDKSTVDAMEIWAIETKKPEYNIAKGGSGGDTFNMHSEEEKQIIRNNMSLAFSGEKNSFYGKKHTEEAKQKMSKAKKGKSLPHTDEWNMNAAEATRKFYADGNHNSNYGKCFDEEHKSKIASKLKGNQNAKGYHKGWHFVKDSDGKHHWVKPE